MPTNYTEHYALSQWEPGDKVQRTDFNADNAKIDAALASQAATLAGLTTAVPKLGNCQTYTANYIGATNGGKVTHIFPHKPCLVMIVDLDGGGFLVSFRDMKKSIQNHNATFAWDDNTVTWFCAGNSEIGMNYPNRHYQILAFLDMSN